MRQQEVWKEERERGISKMSGLLKFITCGSGKSTLLHLLGGVDRPTSGRVFIDGQDIYKLNDEQLAIFRRRQVGLIYQFYNLIPILNVEENIPRSDAPTIATNSPFSTENDILFTAFTSFSPFP